MRAFALLGFACLALAGCIQIGGGDEEPERIVYVTETAAPPTLTGPPTYLKLNVVFNQYGAPLTVQAQAYGLDSKGQPSYAGFNIRALAVSSNERNEYNTAAEWVPCDEDMEGIRIKVFSRSELEQDLLWSGIHCTGDTKQYFLTIPPNLDLKFGDYTGSIKPAPAAPTISFNKDSDERTLTVIQASGNANWTDINHTACPQLKGTPGSNWKVMAGDKLSQCTGTVKVTHVPSDSLLYETTFT